MWRHRRPIIGSLAYGALGLSYTLEPLFRKPVPAEAPPEPYEYVPLAYVHDPIQHPLSYYGFSDPYKHAEHRWDQAVSHDGKTLDAKKNQRDVVVQRPAEKAREKKRDVNKGFGTGAKTSKAKDEL